MFIRDIYPLEKQLIIILFKDKIQTKTKLSLLLRGNLRQNQAEFTDSEFLLFGIQEIF